MIFVSDRRENLTNQLSGQQPQGSSVSVDDQQRVAFAQSDQQLPSPLSTAAANQLPPTPLPGQPLGGLVVPGEAQGAANQTIRPSTALPMILRPVEKPAPVNVQSVPVGGKEQRPQSKDDLSGTENRTSDVAEPGSQQVLQREPETKKASSSSGKGDTEAGKEDEEVDVEKAEMRQASREEPEFEKAPGKAAVEAAVGEKGEVDAVGKDTAADGELGKEKTRAGEAVSGKDDETASGKNDRATQATKDPQDDDDDKDEDAEMNDEEEDAAKKRVILGIMLSDLASSATFSHGHRSVGGLWDMFLLFSK